MWGFSPRQPILQLSCPVIQVWYLLSRVYVTPKAKSSVPQDFPYFRYQSLAHVSSDDWLQNEGSHNLLWFDNFLQQTTELMKTVTDVHQPTHGRCCQAVVYQGWLLQPIRPLPPHGWLRPPKISMLRWEQANTIKSNSLTLSWIFNLLVLLLNCLLAD